MKVAIAMQSYTDQTDEIETANITVELPAFHDGQIFAALCKHFSVDPVAFSNDKTEVRAARVDISGRVMSIVGVNDIDGTCFQIIARRMS